MPKIEVVIPVNGSWPSEEDLITRNAVIDALDEADIGTFVGAGGGLGAMDFSYEVGDAAEARRRIEGELERHISGRQFAIRVS